MASPTVLLIKKELLLELRNKQALGGIILYVVGTIFVCYLSFRDVITLPVWNALFWIILLFASLNAVSKTFLAESRSRQLYMYTLASPQAIILSKICYNLILVSILMLISLLFYGMTVGTETMLFGSMMSKGNGLLRAELSRVDLLEKANIGMYIVSLIMGAIGMASTFTMVSGIAAQTNNNLGISAILGFPIILPMLLVLIDFSQKALSGSGWHLAGYYISVLLALNLIIIVLSYLLFPYLWRD